MSHEHNKHNEHNCQLTLNGASPWMEWLRRLARHADVSLAECLAKGSALYAQQIGFAEPPPARRRTRPRQEPDHHV